MSCLAGPCRPGGAGGQEALAHKLESTVSEIFPSLGTAWRSERKHSKGKELGSLQVPEAGEKQRGQRGDRMASSYMPMGTSPPCPASSRQTQPGEENFSHITGLPAFCLPGKDQDRLKE